eukprot:scaffold71839_cov30-Attheya_sp.AAC.1
MGRYSSARRRVDRNGERIKQTNNQPILTNDIGHDASSYARDERAHKRIVRSIARSFDRSLDNT